MRIVIDVPEHYAEAMASRLARLEFLHTPEEVRRCLRLFALEALEKFWWNREGVVWWRQGPPPPPPAEPQPWPAVFVYPLSESDIPPAERCPSEE